MVTLHPEYVVEKKQRKAVMLPIAEWEHIILKTGMGTQNRVPLA